MSTTKDVTPPPGATWVDDWEDDQTRLFTHDPVVVEDTTIYLSGVQHTAGRTERAIHLTVSGNDGITADLTPTAARKVAAMLQNFADTAELLDEWASR